MLHALRPALATTAGKLIILSSPYAQSGELYNLHQKHWGKDDSTTLIWKASAPVMNPSLPDDYLERMAKEDPDAYRSEVLGEFRAGTSTLLDPDAIDQCVGDHVELPPEPGMRYEGFIDVSGGRSDDFTVAIGHVAEPSTEIVIDVVRYWAPPFDPQEITREAARLLKRYKIRTARSDRYAAEWSKAQFKLFDIELDQSSEAKSDLYLGALLPVINSGGVRLPQVKKLLAQLRLLERRRGRNRDVVDHPPSQHDDLANACAGVIAALAGEAEVEAYATFELPEEIYRAEASAEELEEDERDGDDYGFAFF
jgi:hypothetical protein